MPRTVRTLFALLSLLFMVGTAVSTPPAQNAFAGPKSDPYAKQIKFSCEGLVTITVTGHNQYYSNTNRTQPVTHTFPAMGGNTSDRTFSALTTGWWWVGDVTVTWTKAYASRANNWKPPTFGPINVTVPSSRNAATVEVYCPSK